MTDLAATPELAAGPESIACPEDAWRLARALLPGPAYDYCAGGAGGEAGMGRNTARLADRTLLPRVFASPAELNSRVEVPGGILSAPILVAPMGLQALCHPEAEVATASAAADLGLGFILSVFASRAVEEVAAGAGPGVRWQQLYMLRDQKITRSVMDRAHAVGCAALVVTADVPVVGRRHRDLAHRFDRFAAAPPALIEDPEFRRLATRREAAGAALTAQRVLDEIFPMPSQCWSDLERLISWTELPVLVKGILAAPDAVRAIDVGAAGIVVSTHGGRQSAQFPAAIDALGPVVTAVGGRIPVYFDSGPRNGSHIAVALALGAQAVLLGRPVLWGLAAGGRAGARRVLEILTRELRDTMTLTGAATLSELRDLEVGDTRSSQWAKT
jgi:isopentenyl diphosphate isomerase/L-lactate dehydrogenase-like FMN-dependent dehydrogenase